MKIVQLLKKLKHNKLEDINFGTRLSIKILFFLGPTQFIYTYIASLVYPSVDFNFTIPIVFLFFNLFLSVFLFLNAHKPNAIRNRNYFVLISFYSLSFFNFYKAFNTNFHLDYLLGSISLILAGILVIEKRITLLIYCISIFLYLIILFIIYDYNYQIKFSILFAVFFIIIYSFFVQNAFLLNVKLIKKSKNQLEDEVKQRTFIIQNKLEIIEQKNKDLEEYAHVVSHDLKAPLRNINTLVNWVIADNKEGMGEHCFSSLNLVLENVEKMDLLIKGILDYSTIDKLEAEDRQINLNLMIDEVTRTIIIPSTIEIKAQENLPYLYGNAWRFKQVFQNLIQNAIKYNDKEKGLIEVGVIENETQYKFFVKDNGIGIHADYHERIFKVFTKLDSNNLSSGIGLSIVKKIIQHYKGEIWLESQENQGTTFFFTIPK